MRPIFASVTCRRASAALAVLFTALPAHALFRFNEGRDEINVTAYIAAGYDSNINAGADSSGDMVISSGASLGYSRKAGLIGITASLGWDLESFLDNSDENALNPAASLEFSKSTGRATGSVQLNSSRNNSADPTIGQRTESWNYGVSANVRYPVIDRYSIAGNVGWQRTDYADGRAFSDLDSYTIGTDVYYSVRSDRDLFVGYRYRAGDASFESSSVDHSVYLGVSGRIVSKLNGSASVGMTKNKVSYPRGISDDSNDGVYASVSTSWAATRKASFALTLSEDFSTTSTNYNTRTTSASLSGQFTHTTKFSTNANLGGGMVDFLSGYIPGAAAPTQGFNGQDRKDTYFNTGVGASYTLNNHFTLSTSYGYYRNWSDLSDFTFARHTFSVTLSTRW